MAVSIISLLILFKLLVHLNVSHALTQEQSELIDNVVELFQDQNHVQGLGLAVVQNGETVLAKGYGKRNIVDNLDVEDDTLFAVGSVSKGVTSLLVVKTLSELFPDLGKAVLDTPIVQLGNNLNFTLSDRFRSELVTFRDLLTHRTCLYNDNMIVQFQAATYEEFVYRSRYDYEANCSFRNGLVYNNAMYAVAGSLIGKLAGSTYPELMAKLFSKLEMTSSRVLDAEGSNEDLPNMSRAYTWFNDEVLEFNRTHLRKFSAVGGAGGVLTTASDMANYLKFHLNGGRVSGEQVLSEEVLNWLYTVVVPLPGLDFTTIMVYGYGLGLINGILEGKPCLFHPGHLAPFASYISLFPGPNNTNMGIFCTDNGPGATGGGDRLSHPIIHILIKQILEGKLTTSSEIHESLLKLKLSLLDFNIESLPVLLKSNNATRHIERKDIATYKLHAADLVGLYGSPQNGELTIAMNYENPETLHFAYGKWGIGILTPRLSEINVYDLEFTTTVVYDFFAFGLPSVPTFAVNFLTSDTLDIVTPILPGPISFVRDATLDTFPEIPWDPESCVP